MLQWGRDVIVAEIVILLVVVKVLTELQWGRDVIVAEIGATVPSDPDTKELQWGRDVIVAEIRRCRWRVALAEARFNGAATLSSRKSKRKPRKPLPPKPLQWGRDVIVAEIAERPASKRRNRRLQWGRDVIVAEIPRTRNRSASADGGFNGAATLSSRKFYRCGRAPHVRRGFNGAATLSSRK